jgi:hypothetical protein
MMPERGYRLSAKIKRKLKSWSGAVKDKVIPR